MAEKVNLACEMEVSGSQANISVAHSRSNDTFAWVSPLVLSRVSEHAESDLYLHTAHAAGIPNSSPHHDIRLCSCHSRCCDI